MKLKCDHCSRTASGTEIELLDEGWAWLQISTPLCKRFTACPDHGKEMTRAAFEAIMAASPRHAEVL